jgi:type 1 fimbria pilin
MNKFSTILIGLVVSVFFASAAFAGSIRVESDGNYSVDLKCSGSSKTIKIPSGTTTVTFHSTSNSCDIAGGDVKWPVSKLENNGKWKIKSGTAQKN